MRTLILATLGFAAMTGAAPAEAQRSWDWSGGRPGSGAWRLVGPGVPMLIPELRASVRGRAFVMRNFDLNGDRVIGRREAALANRTFIQIAGADRPRFNWDRRDSTYVVAVEEPARGPIAWDRRAMRDYGFRQTPRGATMTLSEQVLFDTDSATLRPGAIARLRPLAAYLRANPGVRVAIDGHTDSRASDAYNKSLSLRRADAVRGAFDDLGVTRARFSVEGFGESQPVASNATPQGMQRNRRVEVTLLGQRADRLAGE
ncbi:OmpA family protein [Sphingomonas sp. TZW2008]|uniref:OmpA family protein n=1 Tax=Sphingomonas sp. TZW2008 TaxID=1917973 RepID=UPI000A26AD25|nr:OmpA family protein [Sphingomonas sp. TZW2008]